jgi:hypothetical protein
MADDADRTIQQIVNRVQETAGASSAYPITILLIRRRARNAGMDSHRAACSGLQIACAGTSSLWPPVGGPSRHARLRFGLIRLRHGPAGTVWARPGSRSG